MELAFGRPLGPGGQTRLRQKLRRRSLALATACLWMTPREMSQNTTSHPKPFSKKNMKPARPMVWSHWVALSMGQSKGETRRQGRNTLDLA